MEALQRFAAEAGLDFRRVGAIEGPWSVLRWGQARRVEGIARGSFPGGREAALAGLVITAAGPDGATGSYPHYVAVTEVPEVAGAIGWLEVRSLEARDFGQLPPGAGFPAELTREIRLESEFFAQRFEVAAGPDVDPGAVVQLFSPVFLHWYAYESPYAMSLELLGGRLCLHAPADLRNRDRPRSIWEACGRISAEAAREGLENLGAA